MQEIGYLSYKLFFLTTRFAVPREALAASLFLMDRAFALWTGLAYGGGLLRRAASQSNGSEAERDSEFSGEIGYIICVRGVKGVLFLLA